MDFILNKTVFFNPLSLIDDEESFSNSSNIWNYSSNNNNKTLMESKNDYYGLIIKNSTGKSLTTNFPDWIQTAWITAFIAMISISIGGNCIVIWIVIAHRRMRTVTNYFLVNLSIADLLLTLFNCIFNSFYMIQRNWPFGTWYCTASNFIANSTVVASVLTLTGISCDRYLAIVHPLKPRMTKTCSLITIFLIWSASILFASPCLLYSTIIIHRYRGIERVGCIMIWPDNKLVASKYDLVYQMLFLIIAYLVPMIMMSVSYTIMGKVLWGTKSIGELTQRQIDSAILKRKVVKMFILVVVIFGLCWFPYHGYFIYIYYDPKIMYKKYTQHIYLSFYWLAMSNAMVNPLIYYWMNARFRQYFQNAVCGWKSWLRLNRRNNQKNSINSFTKSAGGICAAEAFRISRNLNGTQNEKLHYELIAGINGIKREQQLRMSNRATKTTSIRNTDKRKTTDV